MSWLSPIQNVVNKCVIKSWVLFKMSSRSMNCLSLTSDHLSCVRDPIWASFQSWVLMTETVTFWQHCSQSEKDKNHQFACRVRHIMMHFHWVSASSYHGYVHCFRWWISRDAHDILQLCLQYWLLLLHLAQQPLSVKACLYHLVGLAFSDLSITTLWGNGPFGAWTHDGHGVKSYELTTVPRERLYWLVDQLVKLIATTIYKWF